LIENFYKITFGITFMKKVCLLLIMGSGLVIGCSDTKKSDPKLPEGTKGDPRLKMSSSGGSGAGASQSGGAAQTSIPGDK
jgi:hypothetical protein